MDDFEHKYGATPVDANYLRNISQVANLISRPTRIGYLPREGTYIATFSPKVLQRTGSLFLGLGDPEANEDVSKRTDWMLDKSNANRFLNEIEGEPVGFESEYLMSEPAGSVAVTMDREDNYVAVITSLNTWFGSRVSHSSKSGMSCLMHVCAGSRKSFFQVMTSNGVLLNNALSNFDNSPTSGGSAGSNRLSRGRRPLSLGVPALAVDLDDICGQRILVGGAAPDTVGEVRA